MAKSTKVDFRELSETKCSKCGKRLKINLINRNPKADRCYKHWVLEEIPLEKRKKRLHYGRMALKANGYSEKYVLVTAEKFKK